MKNFTALLAALLAVSSVSAVVPVGETITLYSVYDAKYVKVDVSDNNLLNANSGSADTATEQFVVEAVSGSTNILLKALCNNLYVQRASDVKRLRAIGTSAANPDNQWEWVEGGGGVIHLRNVGNGSYVTPNSGGTLKANSASISAETEFTWGVAVVPPTTWPRIADTLYSDFDTPLITVDAVEEFGADNTGATETSAEIQAALDAASAEWAGIVYLPAGQYLLQNTLDVPDNVTLRGDWKRPTDGDRTVAGTILLIDHGAGTTGASPDGVSVGLLLREQAGIRDLNIYYPAQTLDDPSNPIQFPYAIDAVGSFGTVRNVTLVNAYEGINEATAGFPTAISVYGAPIHLGIYTANTLATPRYENINFMPEYWSESGLGSVSYAEVKTAMRAENGNGFLVGSGGGGAAYMGIRLKGYDIGLQTFQGQSPRMFDFEITDCRIGLHYPAAKNHGWVISKGRIEAEEVCLLVDGTSSYVALNNVTFSCDGPNAVEVKSGEVTLQNCTFERWGSGYGVFADTTGYNVGFSVVGCDFQQAAKHVYIADDVDKACIVGNTPRGDAFEVENHSTSDSKNLVIDKTSVHFFVQMDPVDSVENILKVQRQIPRPPAGTSHVFNVYDYGADGTGNTDDTPAFQAALNAAGALATTNAGCIVYAPHGVYRIDGYLNVPSHVELRGCHDGGLNQEARAILALFPDKDNPSGPATIKLQAESGMRGFGVMRPEQKWNSDTNSADFYMTLHEYPAAIEGTDHNWAYDMLLANTYVGLDFTLGGGHRTDFVYGTTLHALIKIGGNGAMSEVLNTQSKTSAWRTMSDKNSYPPFQASGFGDGMPSTVGIAGGLGDTGTGVVFEGDGTFRAMGHFINQSGDGLYHINGSPTINMYLCGGEGAGIGIITDSDDGKAMDVEVVGNSYHTYHINTTHLTSPGDRIHFINCKQYGNSAPTHIVEGGGHIVLQQSYRGAINQGLLILNDTATGIVEGGYMDGRQDYTIRTHDDSQAKIIGTLSTRKDYVFHSDDESEICVVSICPDDFSGISGTGGAINTWTAYDAWSVGWPAKIGSSTNDFDGDLLDNFGEYALDGNPMDANDIGAVPFLMNTGSGLQYVHAMRSDDASLVYTVESCTDLVSDDWSPAGFTVFDTDITGSTLDFVTYTIPTSEPQMFIRLNVRQ